MTKKKRSFAVLVAIIVIALIAPTVSAQPMFYSHSRREHEGRRVSAQLRHEGRELMREWDYDSYYNDDYEHGYRRNEVGCWMKRHPTETIVGAAAGTAIVWGVSRLLRNNNKEELLALCERGYEDACDALAGKTVKNKKVHSRIKDEPSWRIENLTPTRAHVLPDDITLEVNQVAFIESPSKVSAQVQCQSGKWVQADVQPDTEILNTLLVILPDNGCR